jgi:hypothetical protein
MASSDLFAQNIATFVTFFPNQKNNSLYTSHLILFLVHFFAFSIPLSSFLVTKKSADWCPEQSRTQELKRRRKHHKPRRHEDSEKQIELPQN